MSDEIINNENSENAQEPATAETTAEKAPLRKLETPEEQHAAIESLLFAQGEPLGVSRMQEITNIEVTRIEEILIEIREKLSAETSGFELVQVAEKFQFRTKASFAPFVRELKAGRPRRLSPAALETLSVVAYRQPVVRSDIEKIRGVDVTPTLKTLLERDLIRIVGHQATVGQPALYGTTEEFLKLFGLSSLSALPTLREVEELERDPGESGEQEEEAGRDMAAEEAATEASETMDASEESEQPAVANL